MPALPPLAILCPNLSSNSLGRALLLAELAANETSVRIIGVRRGDEIWRPARGAAFPIEEFPVTRESRYSPRAVPWLRKAVRNELLLVSKALPHSLGLALAAGFSPRRMVIDVDDWESGFFQGDASEVASRPRFLLARARSYLRRFGANAFVLTRCLEEIARRSPHHLVSNRWLQARFGGELLYHVRDPERLHPQVPAATDAGIIPRDRPWVAFVGTPRPHKGLEVLIRAVELQQGPAAAGLLVMGAEAGHPLLLSAQQRLGDRFVCLPQFPFEDLPSRLALADVIAVPSLNVPAAWGQIPAKLFDALAMGKPVVVSDVNDMPDIAHGCGIVTSAGDAVALAGAITQLASSPELRKTLGEAGRQRFLARFTYAEGRKVLSRVLHAAVT
jgi:glycosyltransferase involved in cell wall biosynthesis